jgi:hypothetical protein
LIELDSGVRRNDTVDLFRGSLVVAGEAEWAIAFSAAVVVHELWRLAQRTRGTR